jgi:hypothetical protein
MDLNEFSNNIEGLSTCSSSNEKIDVVVEIVDVLVN